MPCYHFLARPHTVIHFIRGRLPQKIVTRLYLKVLRPPYTAKTQPLPLHDHFHTATVMKEIISQGTELKYALRLVHQHSTTSPSSFAQTITFKHPLPISFSDHFSQQSLCSSPSHNFSSSKTPYPYIYPPVFHKIPRYFCISNPFHCLS